MMTGTGQDRIQGNKLPKEVGQHREENNDTAGGRPGESSPSLVPLDSIGHTNIGQRERERGSLNTLK